jgi:hypothetical protein
VLPFFSTQYESSLSVDDSCVGDVG